MYQMEKQQQKEMYKHKLGLCILRHIVRGEPEALLIAQLARERAQ